MRVLFIASGEFACPTLTALHQASVDICCVITQPDRPTGRGRHLSPTPVKRCALELGLPVMEAPDINDQGIIEHVGSAKAVVGVVVAFGQKIGPLFRSTMPGGCINLHASLLPRNRGAAPFQWAVIRGEPVTGVTVFKLTDRMDAGPILKTVETPIGETETASELHDRLSEMGPGAVADALDLFADGNIPDGTPQDDALATKAPKFKKDDGRIRFAEPADVLARRINGLWSWPGAVCRFLSADASRDEVVTLARAKAIGSESPSGRFGYLNEQLHVAASPGHVEILEIKPQSGKLMSWQAFANGRHVRPGDRLVPVESFGTGCSINR